MIKDVLDNREQWHIETGACLEVLRRLPDSCVDLTVTSPPYYGLRDYHTDTWEGGDPACAHKDVKQERRRLNHNASGQRRGRTQDESKLRDGAKSVQRKCAKCGAIKIVRQIGVERTPEEYIANLVAVFEEVRRVLKPHGTLWLNLGDSWASDSKWGGQTGGKHVKELHGDSAIGRDRKTTGLKQGDMVGIPWRTALTLQAAGWYLRSDNLWLKLSAMPLSVKGWRWERCRIKVKAQPKAKRTKAAHCPGYACSRDHAEKAQWQDCPGCSKCEAAGGYVLRRGSWRTTPAHEYLFMLAKSGHYFADGFAVRQQLAAATILRDRYSRVLDDPDEQYAVAHDHETVSNPEQGANLRSFFIFKGENFVGDHYAVFPSDLPALAIRCGTSEKGNCAKCGLPYVRVVADPPIPNDIRKREGCKMDFHTRSLGGGQVLQNGRDEHPPETLDWWPSCTCKNAGKPVPPLVLDCFSGSGTTGLACLRTGRRYLGIELNEQSADDSRYRLRNRGHAVRKPKREDKKGKGLFTNGLY